MQKLVFKTRTTELLGKLISPLVFSFFFLLPFSFCLSQTVVDKMVASVNGGVRPELITYSDLIWQLALQPSSSLDNPKSEELNQALRLLEDQHLILQEAEKLPTTAPTLEEVQKARDELARHFPPGDLAARMAQVGLTSTRLDEIVSDRLAMEKYLDFRFRSFVLITQKDISDYYTEVFVPQEKSHGRIVPTLNEAHDRIERTLTENKIEAETDAFLDSLRERAEIVILNPV